MKSKFIFIAFLIMLSTNFVRAQIVDEIKSYVDSNEFILNNGRKMLMQKVTEKDYLKVKEIYEYLNTLNLPNNFAAFDYTEELTINLFLADWDKLATLLKGYKEKSSQQVYPEVPEIYSVIYYNVKSNSDSLSGICQNSVIDDESKELIQIILHLYKNEVTDSAYNSMLEAFQEKYKPSRYKDFIDNYLPEKNIEIFLGLSLGSGIVFTTNNLAKSFKPGGTINFSFDLLTHNLYSSAYINFANLKLREPFSAVTDYDSLAFEENEAFMFIDFGVRAGYIIAHRKNFQIAPFVSLSGSFLESKRYSTEYNDEEYRIYDSFVFGGGIYTEVKLKEFNNNPLGNITSRSYISIKFETGYNIITKFTDNDFEGNAPYINAALVWRFKDFNE